MSYIEWRRRNKRICKICQALIKAKRSRFVVCNLEGPEYKLFVSNGHTTNKVLIKPLPIPLKENLLLEARRLYSARRRPNQIGEAIAARQMEGKSVKHLREQMSEYRSYIRALTNALDAMGWLGPCERIVRRIERGEIYC